MLEFTIFIVLAICMFGGIIFGIEITEDKLKPKIDDLDDEVEYYKSRPWSYTYPGKGKW